MTIASKQKSIDRLQATLEKPEDDPDTIKFQFKASQRGGNDVLEAEDALPSHSATTGSLKM